MKTSTLLSTTALLGQALALPQFAEWYMQRTEGLVSRGRHFARQAAVVNGTYPAPWVAPGPDDARGPCPGLNTLANHGYLPHDGKNITVEDLEFGMLEGFNIAEADARGLFLAAKRTSPDYPDTDSFSLKDLGREGILEHDISLSRCDRYFNDPLPFNKTTWDWTSQFFGEKWITIQNLADARMGRHADSKKNNPIHELNAVGDGFSWGECASFFEILADGTSDRVERRFIDYWLMNERLPTEIGWKKRPTVMQPEERQEFTCKLMEAAGEGEGLLCGGSLGDLIGGQS